jgi:hypothetical protein
LKSNAAELRHPPAGIQPEEVLQESTMLLVIAKSSKHQRTMGIDLDGVEVECQDAPLFTDNANGRKNAAALAARFNGKVEDEDRIFPDVDADD